MVVRERIDRAERFMVLLRARVAQVAGTSGVDRLSVSLTDVSGARLGAKEAAGSLQAARTFESSASRALSDPGFPTLGQGRV
jgi:hypothetical protein